MLQHRDELSKFIGDEIAKTMSEQRVLERRYEELIEQRASMKGMINKSKYKEIQEEIQDVSRALRESTNNLVRNLKENPNVSGNLIKVQRDRIELRDLLLRCIAELRDRGSYLTISQKVDEENAAKIKVQQLRSREKALRETVASLQEQLTEEEKSFQRTVIEQRKAINQLKDDLLVLKGSTSTDAKFKRKESVASVSAIWREYKLKERLFEMKLKQLEDKLQTESLVHSETKEFLHRKQQSIQEEVQRWEAKYEKDVGELDRQITDMTTRESALVEKLTVLRARKEREVAEEKARKEQQDLENELKKQRVLLLKRQNTAAKVIQEGLRKFVKRKKELDALKDAGKKKKGGAAKGKKKK